MAIERIDSIYDVAALQAESAAVEKALTANQSAITSLYTEINKFKGANLLTFSSSLAELQSKIDAAAKSSATLASADVKLQQAALLAAKAETEKAKATTEANRASTEAVKKTIQEEKAKQELAKSTRIVTTEAEKLTKAQAKAAADAAKAVNAYELLKKSYQTAAEESKRLGAEMLAQNADLAKLQPLYEAATKEATSYYDQLLKLEKAVGQNQRQVGQYENATRGLNASFQQIARELPSLAVNANTFFLAISNNLPIFFDEIQKVREANAELIKQQQEVAAAAGASAKQQALNTGVTEEAADAIGELAKEQALAAVEGQKGTSVFKAIGASIFSYQTLLTVGVTLVTLFAGKLIEMVTALFSSEAALKRQREAAIENNKVYQELITLTNTFNQSVTKNPRLESLQAEAEYLRALNVERTQQLDAEVQINIERVAEAKRASDAIIAEQGRAGSFEATYRLAEAGLTSHIRKMSALRKADKYNNDEDLKEKDEAELASLQSQFDLAKFNFDRLKAAEKENTDSSIAFATKKYEQQTYLDQLAREATERNTTLRAQAEIDANERIISNQLSTEGQLISSLNNVAREQKRIAAARLATILADPSTEGSQAATARLEFAKQREKIEADTEKKIFDVRQGFANRTLQAQKRIEDDRLNDIIATQNEIVELEENSANERIVAANKVQDAQVKLVEDDYTLQKQLLDQKAAADGEYEALEADKQLKLAALNVEGYKRILDIQNSEFRKRLSQTDKENSGIAKRQTAGLLALSEAYLTDVEVLSDSLKNKSILYSRYTLEIEKLEKKAAISRMEIELRALKDSFEEQEKLQTDYSLTIADIQEKRAKTLQEIDGTADEKKRNELKAQLKAYDDDLKALKELLKKKELAQGAYTEAVAKLEKARVKTAEETRVGELEALATSIQQYSSLVQNALSSISEIANIGFDRQKAQIDELNAKQEKAYEDEVKRISQLNLTSAERADQLKILEAQRVAQQTENDRKLRKIEIERARFEKASNIASIISSTAVAVVKALEVGPPLGIALAVAVGALGAAQLARAVATPLPSYEVGTDYHKGGAAVVHAGEIVQEPGKRPWFTGAAKETLLPNLARGAKVITANEVNDMMYKDMLRQTANNLLVVNQSQKPDKTLSELKDAVNRQTSVLSRAISKQKTRGVVNVVASGQWGDYLSKKVYN